MGCTVLAVLFILSLLFGKIMNVSITLKTRKSFKYWPVFPLEGHMTRQLTDSKFCACLDDFNCLE